MFKFITKYLKAPVRPTKLTLLDFSDPKTFPRIQTTSDSSLGGYSTGYFEPFRPGIDSQLVGHYHGNLNPTLPKKDIKVKQSGWSMFKTKNRNNDPNAQFKPFYFLKSQANFWWDFTPFEVLHLKVLNMTPKRKFMVNIQTDTMSRTDLYQHRLFTRNDPRGTVQVQYQSEFEKDRIKSIGLSISDGKFGEYSLLIDRIEVLSGYDYFRSLNDSRNNKYPLIKDSYTDDKLPINDKN